MTRRRGRPPKSDDPATRDRLLDAAADACREVGFDAVTVADVATRAGVTPAAVYNHFTDKAELLSTAGRVAIDRLGATIVTSGDPTRAAHDVVAAFLDPSFHHSRRLILELHGAGARHPDLAQHLTAWHGEFARLSMASGPERSAAAVKAFFLLLLGLCHLDDLDAIDADHAAVAAVADRLVDAVFAPLIPDGRGEESTESARAG